VAVFFGSFFFAIKKERTESLLLCQKQTPLSGIERNKNETVKTIALEDCAIVLTMWFFLFCY